MPKVPVTVNVDFSPLTVQNGVPSGIPNWNVSPDHVPCHNGQNNITWTLTATNIPTGFTAAFTDPGVAFKTSPQWTGGSPQNSANNSTVSASDNFQNLTNAVQYRYTTSVKMTPSPGRGYL